MPEYDKFQQSLLDPNTFSITWELVPGRGAFEKDQEAVIAAAEQVARGGRIHALTLTDNPSGRPAISPEMLGAEVARLGVEPLVHLTCKDKSRNGLEALLYGLERAGVHNLLVMSGDYPTAGYQGRSRPVFDLDPSQLLALLTEMNRGLEVPTPRGTTTLAPTRFFAGAAVSPFKALESEQMGQYYKLGKKLAAGAQFIVTQLGYDARKFQEVLLIMRRLGYGHVPVIGNLYVLGVASARLMNKGGVPGCVVTDKLLAELEQEAQDKATAKAKRLERAARLYALLKGMGYAGVHIGGHALKYEDVEFIIERGEELAPNWQELVAEFDYPQPGAERKAQPGAERKAQPGAKRKAQPGAERQAQPGAEREGWYYFQRDPHTGLNTETPTDRSQNRPGSPLGYRGFRLLHRTLFDPKGIFFGLMSALSRAVDGSRLEHLFTRLEHIGKQVTNECLHCGDCALFDVAYICPMSQCPKNQRNGPCGGSQQGWCEVYPGERQCIYVRAYNRLKHYGQEGELGEGRVPPVDYDLYRTSSWLNYYLGRDHTAKRLGIGPKPEQK